jgi:hypothetical protein
MSPLRGWIVRGGVDEDDEVVEVVAWGEEGEPLLVALFLLLVLVLSSGSGERRPS